MERLHSLPPSPLILNVDDRPASLYWRDRVLREHGFIVTNADSARGAWAAARRTRPNLILLDVHLPDADGRELCQQIKADPDLVGIPIVLISATLGGHANRLEAVRSASADGFIIDPIDPEVLVSTLRKVLAAVKA
jgi:CheY-like chemotaxis protein